MLPLRAASHAVIGSRRFIERVLILGASPLAARVIREIEAQPHRRCTIVGVVDDGAALREPPFHILLDTVRFGLLGRPSVIVAASPSGQPVQERDRAA